MTPEQADALIRATTTEAVLRAFAGRDLPVAIVDALIRRYDRKAEKRAAKVAA